MSNKELFRDMLKTRRIGMGAANRSKTKHPKINKQWLYPYQYERAYAKEISKLQRLFTVPMTKAIESNLKRWIGDYNADTGITTIKESGTYQFDGKALFNKDIFGQELQDLIEKEQQRLNAIYGPDNAPKVRAMITTVGNNVSDWNTKQSQKFFKAILGVEFFVTEPWEIEVIEAWSQTNFELISSLSSEYIKSVNLLVSEGVQFGKTANSIMKEIRALNKTITGYRARLIARDQVGKLNGALTKRRMEDAGIDMYTWMTAGDERVRSKHKTLNNKLMRWDNPNVYSADKGKTWKARSGDMYKGIPGQDIQCRCTGVPFFDDMIEEIDKEIKEEAAA